MPPLATMILCRRPSTLRITLVKARIPFRGTMSSCPASGESAGWINASTASYSATHYGAYAYTTPQGLKIVSINTDFWYVVNIFSVFMYK